MTLPKILDRISEIHSIRSDLYVEEQKLMEQIKTHEQFSDTDEMVVASAIDDNIVYIVEHNQGEVLIREKELVL